MVQKLKIITSHKPGKHKLKNKPHRKGKEIKKQINKAITDFGKSQNQNVDFSKSQIVKELIFLDLSGNIDNEYLKVFIENLKKFFKENSIPFIEKPSFSNINDYSLWYKNNPKYKSTHSWTKLRIMKYDSATYSVQEFVLRFSTVFKSVDGIIFLFANEVDEMGNLDINTSLYNYDRTVYDDYGYRILELMKAVGYRPNICLVLDLETDVKALSDKKKYILNQKSIYRRYIDYELKEDTPISYINNYYNEDFKIEVNKFLRNVSNLTMSQCFAANQRSYMHVEYYNNGNIIGLLKGNKRITNESVIHITNIGNFLIESIKPVNNKYLETAHHFKSTIYENEGWYVNPSLPEITFPPVSNEYYLTFNKPDAFCNEQWLGDNDSKLDIDLDEDMDNDNKDDKDDDDIDNIDQIEDVKMDEDFDEFDLEEFKQKYLNRGLNLRDRQREELEFEDEYDVNPNELAQEALKYYRGLENMKYSFWHKDENLPEDYNTLFRFRGYNNLKNYFRSFKNLIKKEDAEKVQYVMIKLKPLDITLDQLDNYINYARKHDQTILASTLESIELKASVTHISYNVHEYPEGGKFIKSSGKSGDPYFLTIGFRHYIVPAFFSCQIKGVNRAKWCWHMTGDADLMSYVGHFNLYNTSSIGFNLDKSNTTLQLAFKGEFHTSNIDTLILKRKILTGYPYKINKRYATVRYMFFNSEDIEYFKPVHLSTKLGLRGRIVESLGTHGYMKCLFNEIPKGHDTIMMNLFKRVFPQRFTNTFKSIIDYEEENYESKKDEKDKIDGQGIGKGQDTINMGDF